MYFTGVAAAGFGNYLEEVYPERVDFKRGIIPQGIDYGVKISGNSMSPEILDGSIVFVRACPAIESGQIGVFSLDAFCKRLEVDHNHRRIRLVSINPDYDPINILPDQYLHTFGQVIGYTMLE